MKKKTAIILIVALAAVCLLGLLGIGPYTSASAVRDLEAELVSLYGEPYVERVTENGTQSMEFSIKPATWFLTNYNLRNSLGLDYQYECTVICRNGSEETVTTYTGIDPMGPGKQTMRAYLDLAGKTVH